jgi:coproporphyrinogen III oxidase
MGSPRENFEAYIHQLQNAICEGIESKDGKGKFHEDCWQRAEGGGGITRILAGGEVFEKAGVNTSVVHGNITPPIKQQLKIEGQRFFACGISLVCHPYSPMLPTVHANFRYFEVYDENDHLLDGWFGGGADLTPYYLWEEDAIHFHRVFKNACEPFGEGLYPRFKKQCDDYFVNAHRGPERRGVGGIFYDYIRPDKDYSTEHWLQFTKANGDAVLESYLPIVERRKDEPFSEKEIHWQEIRRGRYVEFNLIHDRGTIFGLKSNGRTESILMSLPPRVRFEYNDAPAPGSREEELVKILKNPRNWC